MEHSHKHRWLIITYLRSTRPTWMHPRRSRAQAATIIHSPKTQRIRQFNIALVVSIHLSPCWFLSMVPQVSRKVYHQPRCKSHISLVEMGEILNTWSPLCWHLSSRANLSAPRWAAMQLGARLKHLCLRNGKDITTSVKDHSFETVCTIRLVQKEIRALASGKSESRNHSTSRLHSIAEITVNLITYIHI